MRQTVNVAVAHERRPGGATVSGTRAGLEALARLVEGNRLSELARALDAPLPVVLAALTELSLAGRANLLPGGLAVGVYG